MVSLYSKERTVWQNEKGNLVVDLGPVKLEISSVFEFELLDVESYNNKTGDLVVNTTSGLLKYDLIYEMEDLGLDKKLDINYVLGNIESFKVKEDTEELSVVIDDLTFTVLKREMLIYLYVRDNNDYLSCARYLYEGKTPRFSSGTIEDVAKMQKIQRLVEIHGLSLYEDFMKR